jgi:uncharacterized membrane protein
VIESHFDEARDVATIVLRPNRSWTWRANRYLVYTLLLVSGSIAVSFTLKGMWLVLPFTAIEMSVLLACLWYCVRRTHRQEVLMLSREELVLETGYDRPEATFRYPRFFTRIHVDAPRHPWYSPRIRVQAQGVRHVIGEFLTSEEKRALVRDIRAFIHLFEARPHPSPSPRATTA